MAALRPGLLRVALLINAIATCAAAIVLVVMPGAIPGAVGIPVYKTQFFIAYLLAAGEMGFCVLASLALWASRDGVRIAVYSLVVMHVAAGAAGVMAVAEGESSSILLNVVARVIVVGLLIGGWFRDRERIA